VTVKCGSRYVPNRRSGTLPPKPSHRRDRLILDHASPPARHEQVAVTEVAGEAEVAEQPVYNYLSAR
jgi:hypothetical protein